MKKLTINNIDFAEYELQKLIESYWLFLKVLVPLFPENDVLTEDVYAMMIQKVENIKITRVSYLNT